MSALISHDLDAQYHLLRKMLTRTHPKTLKEAQTSSHIFLDFLALIRRYDQVTVVELFLNFSKSPDYYRTLKVDIWVCCTN